MKVSTIQSIRLADHQRRAAQCGACAANLSIENRKSKIESRPGFTLIELLAVITIMAILMSLVISGVFKGLELTRRQNTERTIRKVFGRIDKHYRTLVEVANNSELEPPQFVKTGASHLGSETGRERRRARVIYLKWLIKQSFPMNYTEVALNVGAYNQPNSNVIINTDDPSYPLVGFQSTAGLHPTAIALYKRLWEMIDPGFRAPNGTFLFIDRNDDTVFRDPSTENGACLALIYEQLGGKSDDFSGAEFRDTDDARLIDGVEVGDGVSEICDSWGEPLRLYRWPTSWAMHHLSDVERLFPEKVGTDPQDPEGTLGDAYWHGEELGGTQGAEFAGRYHKILGDKHPQIYAPLTIVSGGSDRKFGYLNSYRLPLDYHGENYQGEPRTPESFFPLGFLAPDPMMAYDESPLAGFKDPFTKRTRDQDYLDNIYSYRLGLNVQGQ